MQTVAHHTPESRKEVVQRDNVEKGMEHGSNAGGRINFLRRKSSDLFGELFSERNSFIEDGSNYSFYEEISLHLK